MHWHFHSANKLSVFIPSFDQKKGTRPHIRIDSRIIFHEYFPVSFQEKIFGADVGSTGYLRVQMFLKQIGLQYLKNISLSSLMALKP